MFLVYNTERSFDMNLITLTNENIEAEHICCAISNNKDVQVSSKKAWLKERIADGLVFTKGDVRGKCFIEYIPAEKAWVPIDAPNFMFINCLWVSGQFKGQGTSNLLLESCIADSKKKGKSGLVVLSSKKKLPFLSDPKYLAYKGFKIADEANPSFQLMYLAFDDSCNGDKSSKVKTPKFKPQVKIPHIDEKGFVIYYTNQCPFTAKYVPLLEIVAKEKSANLKIIHIESAEQAQSAPAAVTTFCLFHNGEYLTNEIPSEKKFGALIDSLI